MKKQLAVLFGLLVMCLPVSAKYFQFSAQPENSSSIFSAQIEPVWLSSNAVSLLTKVELGFHLPAFMEKAVEDYLATGKGVNPFDPDQLDVQVVYTNGNLSYTTYGFYYENFERDPASIVIAFNDCPPARWFSKTTPYKWRSRFVPTETGDWTATVNVYLRKVSDVPYASAPMKFRVYNEGFTRSYLEVGSDKRHFRLYKGGSFFCIGQDLAWPDGSRFLGGVNPAYNKMAAGGFMDIQSWIADLARNGGNMARVVNVPWSYEFEWDTLNRYRMDRAWELDTLFATCEYNNVKLLFCMEHGTYSIPGWYEEHLDWKKNPYNLFLPGVEMPDDFLTDSTARAIYKKKLRYFFARWGYSQSLGIFEILSEMDLWTLRKSDPEKFDLFKNEEAQKNFLTWHTEMLGYAKQQVPYRPLLTSTCYGGPPRDYAISAFASPNIDVVIPRHCYFTERNDNLMRWNEINSGTPFEKGIHALFPGKPAMIDEMGIGTLGADPNDIDGCNDVTFHNAIWATSFMGTAGSGLYWWQWARNDYRKQNFPALAAYFLAEDFENRSFTLPGHWEDAGKTSKVNIETFYIVTDDARRKHVQGWVHNASYWWGNISSACKDRNGKSMIINAKTGDDKNVEAPRELKSGTRFQVSNLANGAYYRLAWFNTRGKGGVLKDTTVRTNIFGTAKPVWRSGAADWGYKMMLDEEKSGMKTTMILPDDTLNVDEEIVQAYGNHPLDSMGTFTYHWDFGNGETSDQRNAEAHYTVPGNYRVVLTVSDGKGWSGRVEQHVVTWPQRREDAKESAEFFVSSHLYTAKRNN